MRPTAELSEVSIVFDDPSTEPGAVVGTVEIVDAALFVVTRTVLRSNRAATVRLNPGWYAASACLASGVRATTPFNISPDGAHQLVRLHAHQPPRTETDPVDDSGIWLAAWQHNGTRWSHTPAPALTIAPPEGKARSIRLRDTGTASCHALQLGDAVDHSAVTVVPSGVDLNLPRIRARPGGRSSFTLPHGMAATLLALLDTGDMIEAQVVGEMALREVGEPTQGGGLLDIAIGYYLVRTRDPRLHEWTAGIAWHQPASIDGAILSAWSDLTKPQPCPHDARQHLLRAASMGLPVVRAGLELLSGALRHLSPDSRTTAAMVALRPYLHADGRSVLTSFAGNSPDEPGEPVAQPPAHALCLRPRRDSAHQNRSGTRPEHATWTPSRQHTEDPAQVIDALTQLSHSGFGAREGRYRVADTSEPLAVEVAVTAATTGLGDPRFRVQVRFQAEGPMPHYLAGLTLLLQTAPRLSFLAIVNSRGTATFEGVPAAESWELKARPRTRGRRFATHPHAFALPAPPSVPSLQGAGPASRQVLWRTELRPYPDWPVTLVLRQPAEHNYILELHARVSDRPQVLAVAYTAGDREQLLLAPLASQPGRRSTAGIVLDQYAPETAWSLLVSTEEVLANVSARDITVSVHAARLASDTSAETLAAWRAFTGLPIPSELHEAIEDALNDER